MPSPKPDPLPKEVSGSELALLLGLSARHVSKLADAGHIPRGQSVGMWPLLESVRGYVEYVRGGKKSSGYDESKAREKEAKARLAEAAADIQEGKLLPVATVAEANGSILNEFVTRLCNYGDGVASICHQQPSEFIAERVNAGLRSVLREVAKLPHVPESEKKKALAKLSPG